MTRYAIVAHRSRLAATARSSLHPIEATAPLAGWVEATVTEGTVDVDQPAAARIELAADTLQADNPLVAHEIRRRLDARRYPTVLAEVHKVTGPTGGRYKLRIDLTVRDATRSVTGWAEVVTADEDELTVEGGLTVDVRDFQLDPPKIFGLRVHPDMAVTVRLTATAE